MQADGSRAEPAAPQNTAAFRRGRGFLRAHVGDDLLCWLTRSSYVKDAERGRVRPLDELEPANSSALVALREAFDARPKDWATYTRQAVEFHLRNASAWANERVGEDLADQIDPEFVMGEENTHVT